MKNFLIFTAVATLAVLAAIDTKSIMEELAAVTPSQIEMKQDLPSSKGEGIEKKFDNVQNEKPITIEDNRNNFTTPQNTTKEISPKLNPIEKRN